MLLVEVGICTLDASLVICMKMCQF